MRGKRNSLFPASGTCWECIVSYPAFEPSDFCFNPGDIITFIAAKGTVVDSMWPAGGIKFEYWDVWVQMHGVAINLHWFEMLPSPPGPSRLRNILWTNHFKPIKDE